MSNTSFKTTVEWNAINWRKLERRVYQLQKRIYRASSRGDVKAYRRLQKMLMKSWSARALAVRRVTQENLYRIFDRYGREVVSLAVLGDDQINWRPQEYSYGRWGCEMRLRFPIIKLLDYEWETLESSDNPFAVVVMAHRKTQAPDRLQWKLHLIKGLYQRGYSRQDIIKIFEVLDRMMGLPEPLELALREEIRQFEEEKQMPYISSIERISRQEGRQEERHDIIRNLLASRFGVIDEELETIIQALTDLPMSEFSSLLLSLSTLSREELIARFKPNSLN